MAMDGQWMLLTMNNLRRDEGLRFGIGVLPYMKVRYMTDPAKIPFFIKGGLWMPSETRWYHEPELISEWIDNEDHPPEYRTAVVDYTLSSIPRVLPAYRTPGWEGFHQILLPALERVWLGEASAAEAIGDILPELEAYHVEHILPQGAFSALLD